MFFLPYQVNEREYSIFIVLQDDNIKRIKEYDPAVIDKSKMLPPFSALQLRDVQVGYASDLDYAYVLGLCRNGELMKALRYLSRGFRFRPDAGDHNDPYSNAFKGH